jgi:hypothetical protein
VPLDTGAAAFSSSAEGAAGASGMKEPDSMEDS